MTRLLHRPKTNTADIFAQMSPVSPEQTHGLLGRSIRDDYSDAISARNVLTAEFTSAPSTGISFMTPAPLRKCPISVTINLTNVKVASLIESCE
jgi:hypothetical protein